MQEFLPSLTTAAISLALRLAAAVLVLIIGRLVIRTVMKRLQANRLLHKTEGAVRTFSLSLLHIGLYLLLAVIIVGILGVSTSAIAALITSAGLAIGLSFQGSLANLAGGIMLIIFKPFKLGDYIEASGITGTATEINLFYTVILTFDGKRVMVPNGNLMNTAIVDHTAQQFRRVELKFTCARTESPSAVREIIEHVLAEDDRVLTAPDPPFACINASTKESYEFIVRFWCETGRYLESYFALTQSITEALDAAGVQPPVLRVNTDGRDRD